ncbi:streptophobe family protein [Streptomyces sp. ET3-23]|nr:streptophobe family protein [Streptomyces sp. ET3-23]MCC2279157.1 streptophobe family protein [Streptomyces sp. ET3-23]
MTITSGRRTAFAADLLLTSIAAVSWAFLAMAGIAALGLHLLGADAAGRLGPMTAAVVVLAVGGSVTPSGSVEAFGLAGAGAHTTIDFAPLGVSLVGALLLGGIFGRSLRPAGAALRGAELAARAGAVALLFVLLLGGLAWAGSSTVTFDGSSTGLGSGGGSGGLQIPGLGSLGDIGGGLADRISGLAKAKASVGFSVRTGPSLLGGAVWVLAVLVIAVLVSRRARLPVAWSALHRSVRPAASAVCAVLVLAVVAGLAAAVAAAAGDGRPRRVLGAALLGAPNGVWIGVPLGLLVPWRGTASGSLLQVLPDPLDKLLKGQADSAVSVSRLADLEPLVWLLSVGSVLLMLTAGVLTAVRTPRDGARTGAFVGRCALSLGAATAVALPLLVLATRLKADASLSVLGIDAAGAGLELAGSVPSALLLGALWGCAAGAAGALLACATGTAGRRAVRTRGARTYPDPVSLPGPYTPSSSYRPSSGDTNPYLRAPGEDPSDIPTRTAQPIPPPRRPRRPPGETPPPGPAPRKPGAP